MDTDLNSIFESTTPAASPAASEPAPKKRGGRRGVARKGQGKGATRGPRRDAAPQDTGDDIERDRVIAERKRARKLRLPQPLAPKRPRRERGITGPRLPKADKSGVKLDLTTMMGALVGLKAQDADLVGKITQALGTVNKKSRQRVLEAVGRIFA